MTGPLIYLIATEESGDHLGGALMRACAARRPEARFAGVGGEAMAKQGLQSLFPIKDLSAFGIADVVMRLPQILRRIRETTAAVLVDRPDVLVIIDSPDFTHRVARRVRRQAPQIPIIDYVSPSVWAWRPGRARRMRGYIDRVLALLPFEPAAHKTLGGPACDFVGHPLAEQIASLRPSPEEARRRDGAPPLLLMLPGSRRTEVQRLLPTFIDTVRLLTASAGPVELVVPTIPFLRDLIEAELRRAGLAARLVTALADKRAAFRQARAALAASGTVTLELALAGVPTVVAYKVLVFEELIVRPMIKVPSIVLANLVIGENIMPEFLQRDVTPPKLVAALAPLIADTPERARQVEAFTKLDHIMKIGGEAPSARAAEIVLRTAISGA
jgi:lipid-A-disaccharide synthase